MTTKLSVSNLQTSLRWLQGSLSNLDLLADRRPRSLERDLLLLGLRERLRERERLRDLLLDLLWSECLKVRALVREQPQS